MKPNIKELQNRIEVMSKQIYCNYFVNEKLVEENEALLKENNELKKLVNIIKFDAKFQQSNKQIQTMFDKWGHILRG